MTDWLDDPWLWVVALLAIVIGSAIFGGERTIRGHKIKTWRVVAASLWACGVLGVGIATRVDQDLAPCKSSSVVTTPGDSKEEGAGTEGPTSKSVSSGPTSATTKTCEPVSVAEIALLFLPAFVAILPVLKGITIAGLGTVDLRDEFKEEIKKEATEQVIRVYFQEQIGKTAEATKDDLEQGRVEAFPAE